MRRTLRLEEVAHLTHQPVEQLRQWCATGLLPCDRLDGQWALPEDELPVAYSLAAVGPRLAQTALPDGARLLAVAFHDQSEARAALDEIRSRTGVRPSDVEVAPLSIDGMPRVLVAGRIPAVHQASIQAIVVSHGGRIVDGHRPPAAREPRADVEELPLEGYGA
ncbi:MAG TPA: hypothetical protein VFK35_10250 [Candidatus Limnocylindrales bacterium]|nr:hypothetical protein [Candidatus Limnocylindrales bacterium]